MALFDPSHLSHFPTQPGVYLMKNASSEVIYVGKANNLRSRLKQYFSSSGDSRPIVPFLIKQLATIDTIVVSSEKEALLLENTLIKKHQPKFNAVLKDDKTFISLSIDPNQPWPRLQLLRYKGKPAQGPLYFGPYTSAHAARETYDLLTRLFPLRQCSDQELKRRTRPCLLHAIKRCCAPCVNKCTPEEYKIHVDGTISFLKGNNKTLLQSLYTDMETASAALDYERAAALLHKIRQIEHVTRADPVVVQATPYNLDALHLYREGEEIVIAQLLFREGHLVGSETFEFSHVLEEDGELLASFLLQHYLLQSEGPPEILLPISLSQEISAILAEHFKHPIQLACPRRGEKVKFLTLAQDNAKALFTQKKAQKEQKEKILLDLQELLRLNRYPQRIECVDTSNLAGQDPVASLVAFTDGEPDKRRYRLFKLKATPASDDYAAIREVLVRHLTRSKEKNDLPDLMIIDGGKGHLKIALDVLSELDIASCDLIGLAKETSRHDKGLSQEKIYLPEHADPLIVNPRSSLLFFLQSIRDEAHRKAITFNRKQRQQRTLGSRLDDIPGIGKTKKMQLLQHFGSVESLFKASDEELGAVPSITRKDIQQIRKAQKSK